MEKGIWLMQDCSLDCMQNQEKTDVARFLRDGLLLVQDVRAMTAWFAIRFGLSTGVNDSSGEQDQAGIAAF
jgi:hypothetical protein